MAAVARTRSTQIYGKRRSNDGENIPRDDGDDGSAGGDVGQRLHGGNQNYEWHEAWNRIADTYQLDKAMAFGGETILTVG